jgi:predicted nucleic acid-binding protein
VSGISYLFDTNAVLYFLHQPKQLQDNSSTVFVSFVNELELLSYSKLSSKEEKGIKHFLKLVDIINIDQEIKSKTITLRQKYLLKLPDAIICATAMVHKLTLVTNDLKLHKISELTCSHLGDITEDIHP